MVFLNKNHLNHHNKNSYVNTFNEVNNDGDRNRNRSIRDRNRRCSSLYIKKPTNLDSKYLGALLQERCPSYDFAVRYQRGQMRLEILARNDLNVQLLSVEGQNTGVLNAANKVELPHSFWSNTPHCFCSVPPIWRRTKEKINMYNDATWYRPYSTELLLPLSRRWISIWTWRHIIPSF